MRVYSNYCQQFVERNYIVKKRLNQLGVSTKYIAYYYLVDILDCIIVRECKIKSFSREIYPQIAKKYGKSVYTIERDIRHFINHVWNTNSNFIKDVFELKTKPTCLELIYLIKNFVLKDFV